MTNGFLAALVDYCSTQGLTAWSQLDTQHLRAFAAREHRRGLAPSSIQRRLSACRGLFRYLLRDRPWQPYLMIGWITLFGHQLIGNVIDTDHWRHHFMLYGIVWGCIALEHAHRRARARRTSPT